MLQTPSGIAKLNSILSQLSANISGDTEQVRVFSGVGTPEASVAAGVGSLYMRTDGGADTSVYRKESGSADTGWVAIKAPASLPLSTANGGLGADASGWTAGNILYLSATGVISHKDGNHCQLFTSSGTFTAPTGITKVYITGIGSGAGGAGGSSGGVGNDGGGGGGSGAYIINYPHTVVAGNNYTVTINNAGTGGAIATNGVDGGTVVFDTITLNGGTKGLAGAPGTGGAGGVGLIAASGVTGGSGTGFSGGAGANATTNGGGGAGTIFGGVGGTGGTGVAGTAGTGFGAGGGGGSGDTGGGVGSAGGDGTKGFIMVLW